MLTSLSRLKALFDKWLRHIVSDLVEHRWHWAFVAIAILIGARLSHYFEENEQLSAWRYRVFEWVQERSPRRLIAHETVVVLIDDDAYYNGEPAARRPINRRYIAKLVRAVAEMNPAVIAIDFDLRSPEPTGSRMATAKDGTKLPEFPDYVDETNELLRCVRDVSQRYSIPIVLPATIDRDGHDFVRTSDVYRGFDFGAANIKHGYIALDTDKKVVPPTKRLKDGSALDSFALAAVRAKDEAELGDDEWEATMFAGFIRPEAMRQLNAGDVLEPTDKDLLRKRIQHRVVLIGGAWHTLGYCTGHTVVDSYDTPVDVIPGVLIHANYIEAVLDRRVMAPVGGWLVTAGDCFCALLLACALRVEPLWRKSVLVLTLIAVPVVLSVVAVEQFLLYFDVLIVDMILLLHAAAEKALECYLNHRRWLNHIKGT